MGYLAVFAVCCIGCGINMICGFGFGIFAMMFLPYLMNSTMEAAALINIVTICQAGWIFWRYRKNVQWKLMLAPLAAYFVTALFAAGFAVSLANDTLKSLLGVFLIVLSAYFVFIAKRVRIKPSVSGGLLAGGIGGIMSAMFSVGGPPVSLYFSASVSGKEAYLATIQTYFLISNTYILGVRAFQGIVTENTLFCSIFALAGMALGTFLGERVFRRISADTMRKAIYVMMAASGVIMILF